MRFFFSSFEKPAFLFRQFNVAENLYLKQKQHMKKILMILGTVFVLQACGNNTGERYSTDRDSIYNSDPSIDTSRGEGRVDIERRDSM